MNATNHILVDDEVKKYIEDNKLIKEESNNSVIRRVLKLKTIIKKEEKNG